MKPNHNPKAAVARILLAVLFALRVGAAKADIFTLWVSAQGGPTVTNFYVQSNVVAKIVSNSLGSAEIQIFGPGQTNLYGAVYGASSAATPIIVGPATIKLLPFAGAEPVPSFCTIETTSATPTIQATPSSAVVIPADSGGPVTIILESSVDLLTWTPALPGTYGTTTSNRFFRVRAQR